MPAGGYMRERPIGKSLNRSDDPKWGMKTCEQDTVWGVGGRKRHEGISLMHLNVTRSQGRTRRGDLCQVVISSSWCTWSPE